MTIEAPGPISSLNPAWPDNDDLINEGAGHIRVVKQSLQLQFPNLDAEVTSTPSEMNALAGSDEADPLQAQIDEINASVLVGELRMFAGAALPATARWLFCDFAEADRTIYADLFAVVGTTYGAGNGTTTFNLPDFRARSPLGIGTSPDAGLGGGSSGTYALGVKVGVEQVQLTAGQSGIDNHTHRLGSFPSTEYVSGDAGTGAASGGQLRTRSVPAETQGVEKDGNSGDQDAQQPHSNLGPVLPVNFIISISEADYARANP